MQVAARRLACALVSPRRSGSMHHTAAAVRQWGMEVTHSVRAASQTTPFSPARENARGTPGCASTALRRSSASCALNTGRSLPYHSATSMNARWGMCCTILLQRRSYRRTPPVAANPCRRHPRSSSSWRLLPSPRAPNPVRPSSHFSPSAHHPKVCVQATPQPLRSPFCLPPSADLRIFFSQLRTAPSP